jgi:cytochrome P450
MQEQVEMMLLDVFLEGLFEVDLRRVNSEEVGHAMNTVLLEANERIKFPLRKMFVNMVSPRWSYKVWQAQHVLGGLYERIYNTIRARGVPPEDETVLWACLARLKDPATGKPLTKQQLLPEIGAFILAGFDTSSHTIAWCLFNVAANPEVQRRIKSELSAVGLLHAGPLPCNRHGSVSQHQQQQQHQQQPPGRAHLSTRTMEFSSTRRRIAVQTTGC